MWRTEISHAGLNKFRVITGATREEAELKALWQQRAWEEQWQWVRQARERQQQREEAADSKESRKQDAEEQTKQAEETMAALENLLHGANSTQGCGPPGGQNVSRSARQNCLSSRRTTYHGIPA
jgi:hypothetical protein